MTRAALYARISEDRSGEGLGVERQKEDCRKIAESRGWEITGEYVDNDFSAYSGKSRPQFEALLADIENGEFDAVVTYHQDRLTRRPQEFENFLAICDKAGVKHFATVAGYTELGHGDGIMVARIYAAVAANQSDAASRRIRRKNDERAAQGTPHISGSRAYGYALDRTTVIESEASIIRDAAERFIAGESLNSITESLKRDEVKTATGQNDWRTPTLRNLLKSPRIAGLREHRGEVVGNAAWPPIITLQQHEQIKHRLQENAATGKRSPRRYLLSGKVFCKLCGTKMVSAAARGRRRYGCLSSVDFGGCGKVFVAGESLERLIADAVLLRLDTPELARTINGQPHSDAETGQLRKEIAADAEQLDELLELYTSRQIPTREWLKARTHIEERMNNSKRRLGRLDGGSSVLAHLGQGKVLSEAWNGEDMTLSRQRAIVDLILDRVLIEPAKRQGNRLDPSRVTPVWLH